MNRPPILFVLSLVVVASCRPSQPALEKPAYVWNHEDGLCGGTTAIDSKGARWVEGGCESGGAAWDFTGTIPAEQLQRVVAAFAAHPDPATFSHDGCDGGTTGRTETFRLHHAEGSISSWTLCGVPRSFDSDDHLDHFPTPFDETAAAFNAATPHQD